MDPPPQYEPTTALGKMGIVRGFHFLDPLRGLGYRGIFRKANKGS